MGHFKEGQNLRSLSYLESGRGGPRSGVRGDGDVGRAGEVELLCGGARGEARLLALERVVHDLVDDQRVLGELAARGVPEDLGLERVWRNSYHRLNDRKIFYRLC